MASNKIQVKRTSVTGRTPNTTNASNTQYIDAGEFALNITDGILYSSNGSTLITIGANLVNQNITGTISAGNSTINATVNSTAVDISNSTVETLITVGNIKIGNSVSNVVANSSSVNSATYFAGAINATSTGLLANSTVLLLGNSSVNVVSNTTTTLFGANLSVNSTSIVWTGNTTTSPTVTIANTGAVSIGNSSTTQTGSTVSLSNSVSNASLTPAVLFLGNTSVNTTINTSSVNAITHYAGSINATSTGFLANSTVLLLGNSSVNTAHNTSAFYIGTSLIANSTGVYHTGTINAASHTAGATGTGTGGSVSNTTNVFVGNNTINTNISAGAVTVNGTAVIANNLGVFTTGTVNAASHTIGTGFVANATVHNVNTDITLTVNNKKLSFAPVAGGANVYFIQQNDDNFVFYTSNTLNQPRAVFSIFANSITSNLNFSAPVHFGGNVGLLTANGSSGTAGQVLASNGTSVYWTNPAAASVDQNAQYTWTNTHTFNANVAFSGNGIGIVSNTGAIYLGGLADANWKIGRNTGVVTKWRYTNNTIDVITANSNLEGFTIGLVSGNSYFETGYLGTYIASNVTIGNTTSNASISATSLSLGTTGTGTGGVVANTTVIFIGNNTVNATVNTTTLYIGGNVIANSTGANNAFNLGGTAAASYQLNSTLNANIASYLPTYTGVVNASSFTAGATGTGTGGSVQNTTVFFVGNNTINAAVNTTTLYIGGNVIANSTGANNAFNLGGTAASSYQLNSTLNANIAAYLPTYAGVVNASSFNTGNSTVNSTSNSTTIAISNSSSNATITSTSININSSSPGLLVVGNSSVNSVVNSSSANIITYFAGAINATSTGFLANSTSIRLGNSSVNVVSNTTTTLFGANLSVNSTSIVWTGNTTTSPTITLANTGAFSIGNSSTTQTTGSISVANSTGNVQITAGVTSILATGQINAASHTAGAIGTGTGGSVQNTTVFFVGNNTINAAVNTTTLYIGGNVIANSTGANNAFNLGGVSAASYQLNSTLNANIASYLPTYTGIVNAASYNAGATGGGTGGLLANASLVYLGNNTILTSISAGSISVNNAVIANNSGVFTTGTANAAALTVGTTFVANTSRVRIANTIGLEANGGLGSSGQVLTSNGSTVYWATAAGSSNVEVTIQNTNPSTPNVGRVYWNSDLGKLLVYYTDATPTSQWVEAHVAGQVGPTGPAGPIAGSTTQIAFNDSGAANGSSNLVFYKANNTFNTNNAIFSGAVNITGDTTISGSANVGVNLNVTANAAITGNLTVSGTGGITFSDSTTLTSGAAIGFRNMEVVSATGAGSWTVPASLRVASGKWKVTIVGAGAQGGGTSTTAGQVGGGGGSGAVSIGFYTYVNGVNSMTYNIGVGGAGAGTNATGNTGTASNTTYNSVVYNAGGGSGGVNNGAGGAGGTATGGTLNFSGNSGENGGVMAATSNYQGAGGDTPLGLGAGGEMPVTAAGATGSAGTNYGAGGSGGRNGTGITARAGGAGTSGLLIIEY